MRSKRANSKAPAERVVKDIRRKTRRQFSAEEKIRIVLDGLRGDDSIAELCRKEGIAERLSAKPQAARGTTLASARPWPSSLLQGSAHSAR